MNNQFLLVFIFSITTVFRAQTIRYEQQIHGGSAAFGSSGLYNTGIGSSLTPYDGKGILSKIDINNDIDDDNDGVLDATESPICYFTQSELEAFVGYSSDLMQSSTGTFANLNDGNTTATAYVGWVSNQDWVGVDAKGVTLLRMDYDNPVVASGFRYYAVSNIQQTNGTYVLQGSNDSGTTWVDLSAEQTITTTNALTIISNSLHASIAYSSYRIAGVTGTNFTSRFREAYMVLNNGTPYIQSLHPKSMCVNDTDGDGINNQFDLDSDGDGCSDAYESGATTIKTANYQFPDVDSNNDGLVDAVDANSDSATDYLNTYNVYATNLTSNLCLDSDGDGIADLADLDDDNDGILDEYEGLKTCSSAGFNLSGMPSNPSVGDVVISNRLLTTANTVFSGTTFNFQITEKSGSAATAWANLRGNNTGDLAFGRGGASSAMAGMFTFSQRISFTVTENVTLAGSTSNNDNYVFTIPAGGYYVIKDGGTADFIVSNATVSSVELNFGTTGDNDWSIQFFNVDQLGVRFVSTTGDNTAPINFLPCSYSDADFDGDGIPNRLDLDSDNDGCLDAIEGGENAVLAQLVSSGGSLVVGSGSAAPIQNLCNLSSCVDGQGVPIIVNAGGSADVGFDQGQGLGSSQNISVISAECSNSCYSGSSSFVDSDGDEIGNACDLDDDNDGILDTNEFVTCLTGVPIAWNGTVTGALTNTFTAGSGTTAVTGAVVTSATSNSVVGPQYFTGSNNIDVIRRGGDLAITGNQTTITFPVPVTMSEFNVRSIGTANGTSTTAPNYDEIQIIEFYYNGSRVYFDGVLYSEGAGTIYRHPYYSNYDATYATNGPYYNKLTGVAYPSNTTLNVLSPVYPGLDPLEANYRFVINQPVDMIVIKQHANAKQDNIGFRVYGVCTGLKDTDGDGIYDNLDLDSDNDGCPDAIEGSSTTITSSDLVSSSMSGGNIGATSGTYNQSVTLNLGNASGLIDGDGVPLVAAGGQEAGNAYTSSINDCLTGVCYNSMTNVSTGIDTNHGITLLNRAGIDNGNWPMVRKSGYTVLESSQKGFVITRLNTSEIPLITKPEEGMMIYDIDEQCLKINTDGTTSGWHCFSTPACP